VLFVERLLSQLSDLRRRRLELVPFHRLILETIFRWRPASAIVASVREGAAVWSWGQDGSATAGSAGINDIFVNGGHVTSTNVLEPANTNGTDGTATGTGGDGGDTGDSCE
jgi:hypothetical protein